MVATQILTVASCGVINPPTSTFMLLNGSVARSWTDIEHVSPEFLVLVMGQEDQQLAGRWTAADPNLFADRVAAYLAGEPDASGSTIPQQVVKNLFLWPHQDPVRKLVEAPLAEEAAALMSNRRMLELYVNVAQFAPEVFGVCAASWYFFDHSSATLDVAESARLVGLLPSPLHVTRGPAGGLFFTGDTDRDGQADPDEKGFISAKGVWHAVDRADGWISQMGGREPDGSYAVLTTLDIPSVPSERPTPEQDDCRERPDLP